MSNPYAYSEPRPVSELAISVRAQFILRTYAHLFGAILCFTALEMALFMMKTAEGISFAEVLAVKMLGVHWGLVLGAFMLVSWMATRAAHTVRSLPMQYVALGAFVLAEVLVFAPLLWLAFTYAEGAITSAAGVTAVGFAALTGVVFWTRKDFSFLGSLLMWLGIGAILMIAASFILGFSLGLWFSAGMVAFAGAGVLYDTSNVLHHYPEDRYVGAAVELFASVALMFWYILRIFMSRD